MTVVDAALRQVEQGFAVFALRAGAKVPVTEHGFKNATREPDWVRAQLAAGPAGNYGITWPEDAADRVVVFDLDDGGGAERPWRDRVLDLTARLGPLPATKVTNTPSGGRHAFYRWPAGVSVPAGDELFGFTVRWPGRGYLVGPGSVVDGVEYLDAGVTEIAELPREWVDAAIAERPARAAAAAGAITITGGFELPERIPSGRRYATVRDYVASRYNAGLGLDELWELVRSQVAPRFEVAKTEQQLRADFDRVTSKLGDRLGPPARVAALPAGPRSAEVIAASSIDAADLLELDLPPLAWIVPDLIPEGTTVLAGPPKLGKSCFVYQVVVEVSVGGDLLGREITQGDALYLALEDGKRRGQTRLRAALGERPMPRGRLEVRWSAARLGEGLEEELLAWLDAHPNARLVAIDTLQRVRAKGDARRNAYEVDVEDLSRLQNLFKDRPVALLIVHHSKKDAGDDFLASVSGTYGITGSADTTVVLQRKRLETFGKLVVTGRDVEEVEEAVQFNGMTWTLAPRSLAEASFEQAEVYKVVEAEGPVFPQAIADRIGSTRQAVQNLVTRMVQRGSLVRTSGGYAVATIRIVGDTETPNEPQTGVRGVSGVSDDAASRARTRVPGVSRVSSDSEGGEGDTRATGDTRLPADPRGGGRAREDAPVLQLVQAAPSLWASPCHFYGEHTSEHHWTPEGWRCRVCTPDPDAPLDDVPQEES